MVEVNGHAGGIWVLALQGGGAINTSVVDICNQVVSVQIGSSSIAWVCSVVYGSPTPSLRELLWEHLGDLRQCVMFPWMLIGDFNEVLLPSELKGGEFSFAHVNRFARMMENCELMDIGTIGNKFTWCCTIQGRRHMVMRLDRVLVDVH